MLRHYHSHSKENAMSTDLNNQSWRKTFADQQFLISTIPKLIDRAFVQSAFASEDTYWAKPLPEDQIEMLLEKSITLGLYKILPDGPPPKSADSPSSPRTPSPSVANEPTEKLMQIGMARLISDQYVRKPKPVESVTMPLTLLSVSKCYHQLSDRRLCPARTPREWTSQMADRML